MAGGVPGLVRLQLGAAEPTLPTRRERAELRTPVRSDWPGTLPHGREFAAGKVAATVSACRRGGRRFATMAQIESKHDVRRKVREAQAQANRERLKTESDNREDMVAFLVAQQKLTAVDEWESDRHEQVRLEADQRREEQRLEGARALARMRHRGESMASIAQIGGCSEKIVRSYLKELRTSVPGSAADGRNGSQAPAPGAQEVFPLAARGAEVEVVSPVPAKRAAAHVNVFQHGETKTVEFG